MEIGAFKCSLVQQTTTNYTNVIGALVHTSIPVIADTYFQLIFTDVNGCSYNHTTETTIVTDAPRLRLYTDQAAAPNNVLNVTTGQDAKFYIKVEACADLNRRAQIQFQVYKDGVALTDLGQYLTDQYLSVSYFTAQNGITNPNPNNTYYNPIALEHSLMQILLNMLLGTVSSLAGLPMLTTGSTCISLMKDSSLLISMHSLNLVFIPSLMI
jgi:hypothetical protein